jgi:crotonobetainyl-CoA:carnitine CoA-transferase CaiB-like acyl-CoA transferase
VSDPVERIGGSGALAAWRVLDLTDIRGALCGRILADLGADVMKAESPDADVAALSTTAYRYRNANKRGVVLDLATAAGRARLDSLLAGVDVLIENLGNTERRDAGLEPDDLARRHPALVHVALSDFGLTGPRSDWVLDPLPALAASGTLHASGFPDRPPCWMPGHLAHDCASVYGAVGAVAAVMDRTRTGRGQLVEVSAQEAALAGTTPWSVAIEDYLQINPLLPAKGTRNADGLYWVLPASDGWVRTVIGNPKQWQGFLALLGHPEELAGPEWSEMGFRAMNGDVIRLIAERLLTDRTRAQLFEDARRHGATLGVIHLPSEFVGHAQPKARNTFVSTGFPGIEEAPFVSPPVRLSATPSSLRRPAPSPGEDASGSRDRPAGEPAPASDHGLLLDGIRVIEFGMAAVVPEVNLVLSELGADIIKIESASHLDVLRSAGRGRINCAFSFNAECRGRRSVVLDLETDEGRQLALRLCAGADVVAENYRGGVLDRMGLGYQTVKGANPAVIYVSSQGYGRGGPLDEMPAYGPLNLGFAGLHHLWNHPDVPYPCGTSLNHPDHIAGKLLAVGVLAALDHRRRTGEGQLVDMAQTDAAAFLMGEVYLDSYLDGVDPPPRGNRREDAVPHGVYPAAGEDRWLALSVLDDAAWQRLSDALGWPLEPSTTSLDGRVAVQDTIDKRITEWTSARTAEEAAELLQSNGVSAMPVMGPLDHLADPHLAERGFIVTLDHPEVGPERHAGNPVRLSRLAQRTARSAPCLGVDTEDVLGSLLGTSAGEVAELRRRGVCR